MPTKTSNKKPTTSTTAETNAAWEPSSYYSISNFTDLDRLSIRNLYNYDTLEAIIKDPMSNNEILREISLVLYGENGAYRNTVDYMRALFTLAHVVVTYGNEENKDRNKQLTTETLKKIRHKEIVRDFLFKGMVEGIAYAYFETAEMPKSNRKMMTDFEVQTILEVNETKFNASIIPLPANHTKIIGTNNGVYVIAFDLTYFNTFGEDAKNRVKRFPKEIRDAWKKFADGNISANWVVLNHKKTMVFKIGSKREEMYGRPLVLGAIKDILYSDDFFATKRGVLQEVNNKVIYQTFPESDKKGVSSLNKQQQERQHTDVKTAINMKNLRGKTSFFSVAAGTKLNSLDTQNTDIFDSKNEADLNNKIALDLGLAASLLNGVGSGSYSAQQSNLELVSSQVYEWIEVIAEELNKCINENIIKDANSRIEVKYLPITHVNKGAMIGYYKDLYISGSGSISFWIAATGVDPDAYFSMLDTETEDGIYEKYKPHQTSYTLSKEDVQDNKGGRPTTDNPSDATVASRANNGNNMPSPSDNN